MSVKWFKKSASATIPLQNLCGASLKIASALKRRRFVFTVICFLVEIKCKTD
ncbi:hypothetical protein CFter6_2146 [Collimonas fungivorans]|uniref:Uncharacterized protein n=1 Tax=Collimonas fungivorans TaxID=158899 RepID=A0A127PAZ1_9BURK|nr:hypothetical protein CFter6_2146 [Collimonas fungivorans]